MNVGQEIINFTKVALDKVAEIDDIIDGAIEPIKDYTDTLEDIIAPVKSLVAIANLKRKITLKVFIVNYANQLYGSYEINEKETIKLQNFFNNKKNIIYIADIIDNALNAKSLKSTALLAIIAGKIIKDKMTLDYEDLSVIDSLRVMTDIDIENFIILFEYLPIAKTINDASEEYRIKDFFNQAGYLDIGVNREALELTVEKLKRTNGLTYGVGGIGSAGNARGAFKISKISKKLYKLIKDTKIID